MSLDAILAAAVAQTVVICLLAAVCLRRKDE